MKILFLSIVVMSFLSACGPSIPKSGGSPIEATHVNDYTIRFVDREAGVLCYVYDTSGRPSLSCVPLKDTLLWEGNQ